MLYREKIKKYLYLNTDFVRFLISGGINTLLTAFLYQLFVIFFSPSIAYTLSWLSGILFVIFWYPTKVFSGSTYSIFKSVFSVAIYFFTYLLGLYSLHVFISIGLNSRIAIFFSITISTLINFLCMRINYRGVLLSSKK